MQLPIQKNLSNSFGRQHQINSRNTIMKGILTAEMLREFTGHRSEEMTDRYDNPYLIDRLQQFSSSRKLIDKTWEI